MSDALVVPPRLVSEILAGNCVAFVGAGFSAAASLPGWKPLLREIARGDDVDPAIATHVEQRIAHGSAHALDEAAQALEEAMGRSAFVGALRTRLAHPPQSAVMAQRIRWLQGIPFRLVLTTNFDGVLDGTAASRSSYRDALRPTLRWLESRLALKAGPVVKLHGDLGAASRDDTEIVLTRRDYRRRLYKDAAYATCLRAILSTTTILYLGFSFEDAYLNELRSEILDLLEQQRDSAPIAYAVVNDVPPATRDHFRRHEGIELLSYDSRGGGDFSGFDRWLGSLYEATNPLLRFGRHLERRRILWVDPHPENNELAHAFFENAAETSGRSLDALVLADHAQDGLERLREARTMKPFDLVITHWGDGQAQDDEESVTPTAVRLLQGIRRDDLRVPVLVFASDADAERRRNEALGLGALAYCCQFETLLRKIEEVFASAREVW